MSEAEPIDAELEQLLSLDGSGPARRQPAAANAALIGAALDAWEAAPPLDPSATTVTSGAGGAVPWAKVAMLAAAIGAAVGAAVAVAVLWGSTEAPVTPEPVPAPAPQSVTPPPELARTPGGTSPEAAAPEPIRSAPAVEPAPRATRRVAPRPAAEPEDLIARGNELRAERRWAEAEQSYLAASRARPRSSTSHIADVAAAAIRLDHRRDPAGAATLFQRALAARPNGPLALEAREGIARAQRQRGRATAERAALEAIVAHHPGTAAATRARARLAELAP